MAITLAIIWPSILVGAISGGVIFGLAAFHTPAVEGVSANEIVLFAAVAGSVGVIPSAIALCCYAGAAFVTRRPHARGRWLTGVDGACRPMTIGAIAAWVTGFLVAAMFIQAAEPPSLVAIAMVPLVCLLFLVASRAMNRSLHRAAVASRWHARGLCARCGYTISGLTRCPECGAAGSGGRSDGDSKGGPPCAR